MGLFFNRGKQLWNPYTPSPEVRVTSPSDVPTEQPSPFEVPSAEPVQIENKIQPEAPVQEKPFNAGWKESLRGAASSFSKSLISTPALIGSAIKAKGMAMDRPLEKVEINGQSRFQIAEPKDIVSKVLKGVSYVPTLGVGFWQEKKMKQAQDRFLNDTEVGKALAEKIYADKSEGKLTQLGKSMEGIGKENIELLNKHGGIDPYLTTLTNKEGNVAWEKFSRPDFYMYQLANIGSMVPAAALSYAATAAGAPQVGVALMAVTMGLQEKGDAFNSYAEDLSKRKGIPISELSDEDIRNADIMSDYYGIASGMLETIVPQSMINKLGPNVAKKVYSSVLRRVITRIVPETIKSIAIEGGTEGLQRFTQNVLSRIGDIDPNKPLMEGVIDEAVAGAISGGLMGAAGAIGGGTRIDLKMTQEQEKSLEKILEKLPPAIAKVIPDFMGQTVTESDVAKLGATERALVSNVLQAVQQDAAAYQGQPYEGIANNIDMLEGRKPKMEPTPSNVGPAENEGKTPQAQPTEVTPLTEKAPPITEITDTNQQEIATRLNQLDSEMARANEQTKVEVQTEMDNLESLTRDYMKRGTTMVMNVDTGKTKEGLQLAVKKGPNGQYGFGGYISALKAFIPFNYKFPESKVAAQAGFRSLLRAVEQAGLRGVPEASLAEVRTALKAQQEKFLGRKAEQTTEKIRKEEQKKAEAKKITEAKKEAPKKEAPKKKSPTKETKEAPKQKEENKIRNYLKEGLKNPAIRDSAQYQQALRAYDVQRQASSDEQKALQYLSEKTGKTIQQLSEEFDGAWPKNGLSPNYSITSKLQKEINKYVSEDLSFLSKETKESPKKKEETPVKETTDEKKEEPDVPYLTPTGVMFDDNVIPVDRVSWAKKELEKITGQLKSTRETKTDNTGIGWSNKQEARTKSAKVKELLGKKKILEKYIGENTPKKAPKTDTIKATIKTFDEPVRDLFNNLVKINFTKKEGGIDEATAGKFFDLLMKKAGGKKVTMKMVIDSINEYNGLKRGHDHYDFNANPIGDNVPTDDQFLGSIQLPEIFQIAKNFMEAQMGKEWSIKPDYKLGKYHRGMFKFYQKIVVDKYGRKKSMGAMIRLNPKLVHDLTQFAHSLAHELGHFVGLVEAGLPMKKGNLFGYLSSLNNYRKQFLPDSPSNKETLTEADRKRLRAEAVRLQKTPELPLTMEESSEAATLNESIRQLLSGAEETAKSKELMVYLKSLTSDKLKEVARAAMKGLKVGQNLLPQWFNFKESFNGNPNVSDVMSAEAEIQKIYRELLLHELELRHLYDLEVIKEELMAVTKVWRPGSIELYPQSMINDELYADFISMLFNNPIKLKELAPNSFKIFFNYLDSKPEFKEAFESANIILKYGEDKLFEERSKRIAEGYQKAETKYLIESLARKLERESLWQNIQRQMVDKHIVLKNKVEELRKRGVAVADDDNPYFAASSLNYLNGEIMGLLSRTANIAYETLQKNGISWDQFGEFLQMKRSITERASLINPNAMQGKFALNQLEKMQSTMGAEQFKVIVAQEEVFRSLIDETLAAAAEEGIYNPNTMAQMLGNRNYSTFQVIDYITDKISPMVHQQVGTLKEIANAATATTLKMIAIKTLVEKNRAKRLAVEFLWKNFKEDIDIADTAWDANRKTHVPKDYYGDDKALITIMKNGKVRGFYIDPYIAESFKRNNAAQSNAIIKAIGLFNQKISMRAFISLNIGFQMMNFQRDFRRMYKAVDMKTHVPFLGPIKAMMLYAKALRPSWHRGFDKYDALVLEMQERKMLSRPFNDLLKDNQMELQDYYQMLEEKFSSDTPEIRRAKIAAAIEERRDSSKFVRENAYYGNILKEFQAKEKQVNAFKRVGLKMLESIEKFGNVIESLPKIATYIYLQENKAAYEQKVKENPEMSEEEIAKNFVLMPEHEMANFIRTQVGSPDFLLGGHMTPTTNKIFMFSNAILQSVRADIETATNPKTRAGYIFKTIEVDVIPKMLMFLAANGLFGAGGDDLAKWLKKRFADISEYDKANFTIVPVGVDENGKTVYIRIPQDESGRLMSSIVWKIMTAPNNETPWTRDVMDVFGFAAGTLPSPAPVLDIVSTWATYLSGKNPYDSFRGKLLIPDTDFKASQVNPFRGLVPMLKWTGQQMGLSLFYIPNYNTGDKGALEKVVGAPVISNIVGRMVKVSNYGVTENAQNIENQVTAEAAEKTIQKRDLVEKYSKEYSASKDLGRKEAIKSNMVDEANKTIFAGKITPLQQTLLRKQFDMSLVKGLNKPEYSSLIGATNEAKVQIIQDFKDNMSDSEFRSYKANILKFDLISNEILGRVK